MQNFFSRTLTLVAIALTLSTAGLAVPPRKPSATIKQADGTTLNVVLRGGEHGHFFTTDDGLPIVRKADGGFYYAQLQNNQLQPTRQLAHDASLRTASEQSFVASQAATSADLQALIQTANIKRAAAEKAQTLRRKQAERVGAERANAGERRGLVILVNYTDKQMAETSTQEKFNRMFNEEGYTDDGNSMSVSDYFSEQSYGQFRLTFDVAGPVTVSKNMAYYGGNDYSGSDQRPGEMIAEACRLVDDDIDFSVYDWDGDGEAEMVFVVYAGYSEAADAYTGALDDTIWPHQWYLSSQGINLTLDGVTIDNYACSAELNGSYGTTMDGIGTACHEFSHCFGLPDLYDTNGTSNFGMNYWSLLDYGCYCGDGYKPCGYTSYERWASGWLEPTELNDSTAVKDMQPLVNSPEAYVVYNDKNANELYLLENRQYLKSDYEIYGHGLLVLHVDYDEYTWWTNQVNTTADHQRCTIIAADNSYSTYTLGGDPFPGTSNVTSLTDETTPAATLYNTNTDGKKFMHKPITNISESSDGLISFDFMGGEKQEVSGISSLMAQKTTADTPVTIVNAAGHVVGQSTYGQFLSAPMPHGLYILRTAEGNFKQAR